MLHVETADATSTGATNPMLLFSDAADQLDFPSVSLSTNANQDVDFDTFKADAQVILDADQQQPSVSSAALSSALDTQSVLDNQSAADSNHVLSNGAPQDSVTGVYHSSSSDIKSRTDTTPTTEAVNCSQTRPRFVSPKDFELLKVIGMGAFGKVVQVRNKRSQHILAMKIISKRLLYKKGTSMIENVLIERNILQRIGSHPFIVTMHCSFQTREKLFIIMDFLAGGELFLRLGREGIFLEKTAAFYLAEIILAIEHLHSHGILHRDLKPENILLGADGHVCLTDFGLAKDFSVSDNGSFLNSDKASTFSSSNTGSTENDNDNSNSEEQRARTICGTGEYMAPEMIARQGYGRAADYWSLGCIAYEMLSGRPPFESRQGAKALFIKIMTEKIKMPTGTSAAACKLLKGLLNRNVQARLGAAKSTMFEVGGVAGLKKVDFFAAIDWDKLGCKQIEPPAVFSIDHDCDVQHFHDEFTQMPLPRSVIDMSTESFQPRRVESEAFRGFSFIHDDFVLPERGVDEEQSYWESIEEDGESVSECASSKMGDEVQSLQSPPPSTSKRPPRKRKKKPVDQAGSVLSATPAGTANNTPIPSVTNTPEPSECGDLPEQLESLVIEGVSFEKVDAGNDHPLSVEAKSTVSVVPNACFGVPSKTTEEETWQVAKKDVVPKQKQKNSLSQFGSTRSQSPWSAPNQSNRAFTYANGSKPVHAAKRQEQVPPFQSPSAPSRSVWNQGGSGELQRTPTSQLQHGQRNSSAQAAPSTDWRNHSMANRAGNAFDRSPQQPLRASASASSESSPIVWPSLSMSSPIAPVRGVKPDVPPATPSGATKAPVALGAWASRVPRS